MQNFKHTTTLSILFFISACGGGGGGGGSSMSDGGSGGGYGSGSSNTAPTITNSTLSISVQENQTSAFTVTATDADNDSLTYTISGYLGGVIFKKRARLNHFYFSLSWLIVLLFHFFVYCSIQYQDLWEISRQIFWGKWLGTSIYTISFVAVLQFVYPLNKIDNVKS